MILRNHRLGDTLARIIAVGHCSQRFYCFSSTRLNHGFKMKKMKFHGQEPQPTMQNTNDCIWFHLYDSETGRPYRGKSATTVNLSLAADLAEFKDAVKVEDSNALKNVDAQDLKVFKNKDAFDKRNDTIDKSEPLAVDYLMANIGETIEDPLIVTFEVSSIKNNMNVTLVSDPEIDASYDLYMEIGSRLTEAEIVRKLVDKIISLDNYGKELRRNRDTRIAMPFIFLDGSSGMGKTQMAFTLMCRKELKVHYLVCSSSQNNVGQAIYKRYKNVSEQFLECIRLDYEKNGGSSDFYSKSLKSCGFIVSLITGKTFFKPITVAQGAQMIDSYMGINGNNSQTIVVFLDEIPSIECHRVGYLIRMRDLFRELRLVAIFSSSISIQTYFNHTKFNERVSDGPTDWCYISPRYPKSITLSGVAFSEFKNYLFKNSRPLLSTIFENIVLENSNLDISQVLGIVGTRIHELKMKYDEDFIHSQMCLFMMGNVSSFLFFNPLENEAFDLQIKSGDLYKKGAEDEDDWFPSLVFPNPEEDILLLLCLLGNKGYYPISKRNTIQRVPFRKCLIQYQRLARYRRGMLDFPFTVCQDPGAELEASAAAAVSLCSHYEGLEGIDFGAFFSNLLYELECLESPSDNVLCLDDLFKGFSKITIPFLSSPSFKWPESLLKFKYNFGNLWRSLRHERVDFRTDCFPVKGENRFLSGECKNWKTEIPLAELEYLLDRVPLKSAIHFVFVRYMQRKYYTQTERVKSFESFAKGKPHIQNKLILCFDYDTKELAPIPGIPMDNLSMVDGLVLFIRIAPARTLPNKKQKVN